MPNYEFRCEKCGNAIERRMSFEESEKGIKCPLCKDIMERQFTPNASIICKWNVPYKPGLDAKKDRLESLKSLEKRKHMKLNKGGIL